MDNLVKTLQDIADGETPGLSWDISNNGEVIALNARSKTTYDNPEEAFAEARRMVQDLTADGLHTVVNHAELGAHSAPMMTGEHGWRGKVKLLLRPSNQLRDHLPVDL